MCMHVICINVCMPKYMFGSCMNLDIVMHPRSSLLLLMQPTKANTLRISFFGRGSTTICLRTFRLRHFVYRHFVYYCIPGYRTVIHPTSVSANHYFHQFQLPLTL